MQQRPTLLHAFDKCCNPRYTSEEAIYDRIKENMQVEYHTVLERNALYQQLSDIVVDDPDSYVDIDEGTMNHKCQGRPVVARSF